MKAKLHFGLHGYPLPKDAKGKTFYDKSPSYLRLARVFAHLVEEPGLATLTADAGVGKTTAIRHLCGQLPQPEHQVTYICDTASSPVDLYRTLAGEFGVLSISLTHFCSISADFSTSPLIAATCLPCGSWACRR